MSASGDLPNIAEYVGPLLARVSSEESPLLIAIAERLAAARYREWAEACGDPAQRAELIACADREEEIAGRVEALFPNAAETQEKIRANVPELVELNDTLFTGRPIADQYAIQASGERVGASTWRSFAQGAEPTARETFLECAELEERSAVVLERLTSGRG
jgi:hypothetical protein